MQPLGRRPSRFPGKKDCHPKKPYVNWWEIEHDTSENKALEKREVQKDILEELFHYKIEHG
jgi:hypothetical protein